MARILFLTDSAADIPRPIREELSIRVLPFPIAMGERELEDGEDFTPQEFYGMLLSAPQIPTHAQLNPFVFEECYEKAYEEGYTDVIYTCINAKGSATYGNAVQARADFYRRHGAAAEQFGIHIIDSKTYTMVYGYGVVQAARRAAAEPEVTAQALVEEIRDWLDHARVVFAIFDLKFAKKSGRVSAAAAFVGEALGLKPVMTFEDGESKTLAKVRGERNVIPTLLDYCTREREEGSPYLLIRGGNDAQAEALRQACEERLGVGPALEFYIGGVIAINAGPNLVGLIYRQK